MIRNVEKLVDRMVDWLQRQRREANLSCFITSAASSIPSAVANAVCARAGTAHSAQNPLSEIYRAANRAELAQQKNGLIVGALSREEIFARAYDKYGEGLADVFLLGELYYHEIEQLYEYLLGKPYVDIKEIELRGLPAPMIEWVDKENQRSGIITAEERPNSSRVWFRYTLPQKEAISKLYQFEKLTRHKRLDRPVFPARASEFVQ
jgi:NH3-dependent NAD+ synthetase